MPKRNGTRVTAAPVDSMDERSTVSSRRKTLRDATEGLAPAMGMEKVMLPDGAAGALTNNPIAGCLLVFGPTGITDTTSWTSKGC
jgi:hypothetical protein